MRRWFWGGFLIGAAIGVLRNFTASLYCLGCLVGMVLLIALLLVWNYPQAVIGVIVLVIVLRVLTKPKRPEPGHEAPVFAEPEGGIERAPPAIRRKKWDGPYIPRRHRKPD